MDTIPKRLPRRRFLELALAAPLAVGCAVAGGQARSTPAPGRASPAGLPRAGDDPLRAVRNRPLPSDAEPAFVFRAALPFESP